MALGDDGREMLRRIEDRGVVPVDRLEQFVDRLTKFARSVIDFAEDFEGESIPTDMVKREADRSIAGKDV